MAFHTHFQNPREKSVSKMGSMILPLQFWRSSWPKREIFKPFWHFWHCTLTSDYPSLEKIQWVVRCSGCSWGVRALFVFFYEQGWLFINVRPQMERLTRAWWCSGDLRPDQRLKTKCRLNHAQWCSRDLRPEKRFKTSHSTTRSDQISQIWSPLGGEGHDPARWESG